MICSACGHQHDKLICPACTERKSRETYLEFQKQYLPDVLAGRYGLILRHLAEAKFMHLQLIGEPQHVWCGEKIPKNWFKHYVTYSPGLAEKICPRCWEIFERLVKELPTEVA